ncbi:MAG: DUF2071 domain-containing protein [Cyclobacteriaceae bacterium]
MSFLKAEWRKLAMVNYEIDPNLLTKYVPYGTELDLWGGKCYVSLIGFMFQNTRLLGIPIPFHRHFEEVNLRFYVRHFDNGEWKRGVVFIKEIVPKRALSFVANTIYKEHYETLKMSHSWEAKPDRLAVEYCWTKKKIANVLRVETELKPKDMVPNSLTEFITEHYWGYSKAGKSKSVEYEVTHPKWLIYKVLDHHVDVDFELVYGREFGFLAECEPSSVMLAEGSEITVENKRIIR